MTRPRPPWTPPPRDGVGASRVAVSGGPWADVASFLTARLRPGIDWPARMAAGGVLEAQGRPVQPGDPCPAGAVYWYWRELPLDAPEPRVPFELTLLHQDEHLVVIDKPHFLPVTPGGRHLQETALVRLKRLTGIDSLVPMHRLDLETAGVLVFIVRPQDRHAYISVLRERRAHKTYEAVAPWRADLLLPLTASHCLHERPGEGFMQMEVRQGQAADEPNAHTRVELIARLGAGAVTDTPPAHDRADGLDHGLAQGLAQGLAHGLAHYRLTPLTGRKHQLRAQMAALGLPICGDRIYPVLWPAAAADAMPDYRDPLQLLARELAFDDPVTGQARRFVSGRVLERVAAA